MQAFTLYIHYLAYFSPHVAIASKIVFSSFAWYVAEYSTRGEISLY